MNIRKPFFAFLIIFFAISNSSFSQQTDSLYAKRAFISTYIYKNGVNLSNSKIKELYKGISQSEIKYKWSKILKPAGPVTAVLGVGLAVVALKGVDKVTIINGKDVPYKVRSLPKLLIGLSLVVGGLSMVESSNELVQHSVDIYNTSLKNKKKISGIQQIKFGLTETSNIGLTMAF